ncbi:MAG: Asp-tRNA(Asn)/Glu-tRNA(Gln) amidotransferase subunit GatC [Proteobacteria bacterium]|jgi:aspartyl-tRNA(Asn)/glutamyl-tRNA(Gln) amidotransferase subunit C|nr:Asp-tRNA(Asn)/Glu-tRNA(Gln) amidotransferase subunit GatC [Pseudomonadota bacterium]MDA0971211.1 Asp-tRNA(Asn)/Glu-tRNA(Gln) amidotransferase subunit GatC [Pseudomonadota bacterium]MDA0995951.1 Asp-tRNA(Asn)/Glu-tRNA(Gln) amidotransferase subunit GatC [Pseudomonadota bacterium]
MSINKETVKKISKLSRIASNEEFENSMIKDLNSILKFVEQLNELNTSNTEPLSSVVDQKLYQRDDVEKKINEKKDILQNSPVKNENYFVVPKIIE